MIGDQWLLWLLILAVVVRTAVTYRVRRQRLEGRTGADRSVGETGVVDPDAGPVECPHCGAQNELGYRYCRSRVGEPPGDVGFETAARSPAGRLTR